MVGASTKSCHWLGKVVRASEFHNSVGCNGGGVDMLNKILVLKHFTPGLFVAFLWFYKQTGGSSYDHSIEILMQHFLTFVFKIYFYNYLERGRNLRKRPGRCGGGGAGGLEHRVDDWSKTH